MVTRERSRALTGCAKSGVTLAMIRNEGSKGRQLTLSSLPFVPVFVQAFFNLSLGIVSSVENSAALYLPFLLLNLACQGHRIK
jgi:hypothetical protein